MQDGVGSGLFILPFYEKTGYGHRGGIDKFTSVFSYFPEDSISFALVSNGTNYNNNEIPLTVLNAVFERPFEVPDFSVYTIDPTTLDQYTGNYSSEQIPLQITISKEGDNLIAQATGQSPKPLTASAAHTFRFDETGIVLQFIPAENVMHLQQGGSLFVLAFIAILGYDFMNASAHAKIVNLSTNLGSLILFIGKGVILWPVAIPMSICNATGGFFGSRMALKKGNQFIRKIFLIVIVATLLRLGYDVFFH